MIEDPHLKEPLTVRCIDYCTHITVQKDMEDMTYYVSFHKSYGRVIFLRRLKDAYNCLMGRDVEYAGVILTTSDYNKLRNYNKKTILKPKKGVDS